MQPSPAQTLQLLATEVGGLQGISRLCTDHDCPAPVTNSISAPEGLGHLRTATCSPLYLHTPRQLFPFSQTILFCRVFSFFCGSHLHFYHSLAHPCPLQRLGAVPPHQLSLHKPSPRDLVRFLQGPTGGSNHPAHTTPPTAVTGSYLVQYPSLYSRFRMSLQALCPQGSQE